MSDIDIIYSQDYVKRLLYYKNSSNQPVRVIPRNLLTPYEIYESDFNKLLPLTKKCNQHPSGEGRGLGLIHVKSYVSILGMNEKYLGNAPEDFSMNNRLEKFGNKIIFEPSLLEIHLWHRHYNREYSEQNRKIYLEEEKEILKGNLIINDIKTWGEY